MSRFADPDATRTVDLGPCECPGSPHDSDWLKFRSDLSSADVGRLLGMDGLAPEAVADVLFDFIPEWNLIGPDGTTDVSPELILGLRQPTVAKLSPVITEILDSSVTLPNASSAPSRASSRGSASRIRQTPRGM